MTSKIALCACAGALLFGTAALAQASYPATGRTTTGAATATDPTNVMKDANPARQKPAAGTVNPMSDSMDMSAGKHGADSAAKAASGDWTSDATKAAGKSATKKYPKPPAKAWTPSTSAGPATTGGDSATTKP